MPLWQIYHTNGSFQDTSSKSAFAKDISKMYESLSLPAFYVVVQFIKLPPEDVYVGGQQGPDKPFVRIVINHIAIVIPEKEDAMFKATMGRINAVLEPHVYHCGYDSEVHVDQTDRRLWRINGMNPPAFDSDEQRLWADKKYPVWYQGAD